MNKLFIYYTLTGSGNNVASYLKDKDYELRKVEEKFKMPKSFFSQIMTGGFRAGLSLKGKLINYNNDVSNYDEIVIGSPIWNGRFPHAINSVLKETDLSNKKLIFVLYSGGGEAPKAVQKINKLYKNATIYILKEPKKYPDELNKLKEL